MAVMRSVYDRLATDDGYYLTWTQFSEVFSVKESTARGLVKKAWKRAAGHVQSPRGRPKVFQGEWKEPLWTHVKALEDEKNPPEPIELLRWVNENFNVSLSPSWLYSYLGSDQSKWSLYQVKAKALERNRAAVTVEELEKWGSDIVLPKLKRIHPSLLANMDESADQPRTQSESKVVVSTTNTPTTYTTERGAKHVTVCPTIFLPGMKLKPFVIISAKSIHPELKHYGFPQGADKNSGPCESPHAYVVGSSSGYINGALFLIYVQNVLIPGVNHLRHELNLEGKRAGILLDGALAHECPEALELLEKAEIEVIWLPPHSSHLTQPLDLVIFAAWKSLRKHVSIPRVYTQKESRRMIQNLEGLYAACSPEKIKGGFAAAGFTLENPNEVGGIKFDIGVVLGNPRAPASETKTKAQIKQDSKRIKVRYGATKEEAQLQEAKAALKQAKADEKKKKTKFTPSVHILSSVE